MSAPERRPASLRIGDRERRDAAERLSAHAAAGRLTLEELETRLEQAEAARTARELWAVEADLPSLAPRRPRRLAAPVPALAALLLVAGVLLSLVARHPVPPPFIAAVMLVVGARRAAFRPSRGRAAAARW